MNARLFPLLLGIVLLAPTLAAAKVVSVELKFTPYVGDAAKADKVMTVPGRAAVFLNGVPYLEQDVLQDSVPVLFAEHEIGPAVWLPVDSLGPVVRKGKNTIRIEFTPTDPAKPYHARLSWASVTDEEHASDADGKHGATNTIAPGKEEKPGKGKVVLEHVVDADFAADAAWHHYPPITTLGDDDKPKIAALVLARVGTFKPDFAGLYRLLEGDERLDVAKMKAAKCVEAAYDVGVRLDAPSADQLEYVTTGNPEVVVRRKGGHLFAPTDASLFGNIKDEDMQMCAGIALSLAFPPKLAVVRGPDGAWRVVY